MDRVLIIGLDGATLDLIHPWVKEGHLPHIERLLDQGTSGKLESVTPPMTFPAWNAFMTGKNLGKHGIFDFIQRKSNGYEIEVVNAKHRKAKTIWRTLSDAGKRVGVVGVPVNYPPEPINGVVISGFDAPVTDASAMYPPELFEELKKEIGGYIISSDAVRYISKGRIDLATGEMLESVDRKGRAAEYLLKREAWDCFMILFGETDASVHYFWRYHDPRSPHHNPNEQVSINPIFEVYKKVDEQIGKLVASVPEDTTVILMSDHGTGGAGDKVIYLNRWLESQGKLRIRGRTIIQNRVLNNVKSWVRAILPKAILNQLRFSEKVGFGNKVESMLRFSSISWSQTQAYSEEPPYYPNIWINLKGRDPDGIVEPGEEYERVRQEVIDRLLKWRDPDTGKPVVKKAYKREELYHGDYVHKAPDIVIVWHLDRGYAYLSKPSYTSRKKQAIEKVGQSELWGSKFMINRSGSHRDEGVVILKGKAIRKNAKVYDAKILDIAPTILHLLGHPIDSEMDGNVLSGIFEDGYLDQHPIRKISADGKDIADNDSYTYSDDEQAAITKRLQDLGYME